MIRVNHQERITIINTDASNDRIQRAKTDRIEGRNKNSTIVVEGFNTSPFSVMAIETRQKNNKL